MHIATALKAAWQLGPRAASYYAWYAVKLRSGLLRLQTPAAASAEEPAALQPLVQSASPAVMRKLLGREQKRLLAEADEILRGQVRLFGAARRPLRLKPRPPLRHWTAYTKSMPDGSDIKPVWEMGRFAWATTLARAYWLTQQERYAEGFWKLTESFLAANPRNQGPHWSSAQEVALRLISLAFSFSLLAEAKASSLRRKAALSQALAEHAARIPPTLAYARAQNNNHLLSEGLGLWTAAVMLPEHTQAAYWRSLGKAVFTDGIARQVAADGTYAQHSANYHRLMLQLATWASLLAAADGEPLPTATRDRLQAACNWLLALLDEASGRAPNLGPNDGAYILPLSVLPFADFRPALQAAAAALGLPRLHGGLWDEAAQWLGLRPRPGRSKTSPAPVRLQAGEAWAYLRTARFTGRPGHADQLHLDLWWRGHNIAMDAGSYLYTAAAPWSNALAGTAVHNTLMLDGREQMTAAGRFLWLDWAQARVITRDPSAQRASAEHDGYRKLGLTHRRHVEAARDEWLVRDQVLGDTQGHHGRLHWLLPDWPWTLKADTLTLRSPAGRIVVQVPGRQLNLVRAGKRLAGRIQPGPTQGWVSPTYGAKEPALALIVELSDAELKETTTRFGFPR